MEKKRKTVLAVVLVATIVVSVVGTYAFFITQGRIENQKLTVQTGSLALTFEDNDDGVNEQLNLGDSVTKEFIIRNTGTQAVTTNMLWSNLKNTYLEESLSYKLEYKTTSTGTYSPVETASATIPHTSKTRDKALAKNLTIPSGAEYYYKLTITFEDLDINQDSDKTAILSTRFKLGDIVLSASEKLIAKANPESVTNYNDGKMEEMYTFSHPATGQTGALTDYRYIGSYYRPSANNYVDFNGETWRIIGVFTVETESGDKEQLIKIIREDSIGSNFNGTAADWSVSDVKRILNEDYFNQSGDYTSTSTVKGLNTLAQSQVEVVKWYLGGSNAEENLSGPDFYALERGTDILFDGHTTNIFQKVGLMYPSDYLYTFANGVDDTCYLNGSKCQSSAGGNPGLSWLYYRQGREWTQASAVYRTGYRGYRFRINQEGYLTIQGGGGADSNVRPVVYLKSDVKIISGDGSYQNRYVLG